MVIARKPAPDGSATPSPLLTAEHLTTEFVLPSGSVTAVEDVSFEIRTGETLGLVGESGSGKSLTAWSIVRLIQPPGRIAGGRLWFRNEDLLRLSEREMRAIRGADIALIPQEPMTALNPVLTVGEHIAESMLVHGRGSRREARSRAMKLLEAVRVPDSARRVDDYPHQLSGGLRQRVLIAIALACEPSLLIADEPTTALDVTIQAQILDLLREMRAAFKLSVLLVTHDLAVIAETADRVAVMYARRIVETGPVRDIFYQPGHPYTRGLLASIPRRVRGERLQAIGGTFTRVAAVASNRVQRLSRRITGWAASTSPGVIYIGRLTDPTQPPAGSHQPRSNGGWRS